MAMVLGTCVVQGFASVMRVHANQPSLHVDLLQEQMQRPVAAILVCDSMHQGAAAAAGACAAVDVFCHR